MKTQGIICLFLLLLATSKINAQDHEIVKVGDSMPAFTIVSDDGKQFKSSALKGKVIWVNFFATWCPPCQKELAEVQDVLWPKFKDNNNFIMLTIGREHTDAELATYNEKKGFTFPLYPDKDRSIYGSFANGLIPRSYLIGKDGKVIYKTVGFNDKEFETLLHKIESALK